MLPEKKLWENCEGCNPPPRPLRFCPSLPCLQQDSWNAFRLFLSIFLLGRTIAIGKVLQIIKKKEQVTEDETNWPSYADVSSYRNIDGVPSSRRNSNNNTRNIENLLLKDSDRSLMWCCKCDGERSIMMEKASSLPPLHDWKTQNSQNRCLNDREMCSVSTSENLHSSCKERVASSDDSRACSSGVKK